MIARDNLKRAEFKVYAAMDADRGGLDYVKATSNRTETWDAAKAIAAQFPKSLGLRVHRFIGRCGANDTGEVVFQAHLYSKRRRGVNEGGVKRYRSFLKHAEFLGHEVLYDPGHFQSFPDVVPFENDFEMLLGECQESNWSGLIGRILTVRS